MQRSTSIASLLTGLILTFLPADPTRAAQILELDRRVLVSSFVEAYVIGSDADALGFRSADPGTFLEAAVDGSLIGDITNAFGEAFQETDVRFGPGDGFRIAGSGGSGFGIDVRDPGYPSRAQGQSDTSLTITFAVTSPLEFALGLALSAELVQLDIHSGEGPVSSTVSAFARLYGLTSGFLLDFAIEDPAEGDLPVEASRVLSGVLAPDLYVLEVGTLTSLRGFEDSIGLAQAGFGIDFVAVPVPEPGTALLVALGLGVLSSGRRRHTDRRTTPRTV
ncbi:MAG: PEP-CTERM sorting domain-containing protein [Deltaproteobacteria bacterium]|nr:PEP-CTERM sorting domain-containing protein [Deltaproteobacteria bacterium]